MRCRFAAVPIRPAQEKPSGAQLHLLTMGLCFLPQTGLTLLLRKAHKLGRQARAAGRTPSAPVGIDGPAEPAACQVDRPAEGVAAADAHMEELLAELQAEASAGWVQGLRRVHVQGSLGARLCKGFLDASSWLKHAAGCPLSRFATTNQPDPSRDALTASAGCLALVLDQLSSLHTGVNTAVSGGRERISRGRRKEAPKKRKKAKRATRTIDPADTGDADVEAPAAAVALSAAQDAATGAPAPAPALAQSHVADGDAGTAPAAVSSAPAPLARAVRRGSASDAETPSIARQYQPAADIERGQADLVHPRASPVVGDGNGVVHGTVKTLSEDSEGHRRSQARQAGAGTSARVRGHMRSLSRVSCDSTVSSSLSEQPAGGPGGPDAASEGGCEGDGPFPEVKAVLMGAATAGMLLVPECMVPTLGCDLRIRRPHIALAKPSWLGVCEDWTPGVDAHGQRYTRHGVGA